MENGKIKALNYSAHAIHDLRRLEKATRQGAPKSSLVFSRLIPMLDQSVKFILPNCGELVDPVQLKQAHLDLARLPFPCVAFEAPWENESSDINTLGGVEQALATKRIALCWELGSDLEPRDRLNERLLLDYPQGGVFVLPIYWGPTLVSWTVSQGCAFVPYDNIMEKNKPVIPGSASELARDAVRSSSFSDKRSDSFTVIPIPILQEEFDQLVKVRGSIKKATSHILVDTRDEVMMFIQACSVLNCANVDTSDLAAPAHLNKKRAKKGKQPFFSYKILAISNEQNGVGEKGQGSDRAGPRMHLRRGHLRRLPDKVIWVRHSIVNAGSTTGAVEKDYAPSPLKRLPQETQF